jgi:hypothetical protein
MLTFRRPARDRLARDLLLRRRQSRAKQEVPMRRNALICALSLLTAAWVFVPAASAAPGGQKGKPKETIKVQLKGLDEAPVVISGASGELILSIDDVAGTIDYDLSYDDLEGTVTQAHIHIGQKDVAGGIAIWLCQTAAAPAPAAVAALTPMCPGPSSGEVTGTLTAANVIGPTNQAVPPGALDDVITAIRKGKAYGNVHSTSAPTGEVRGQLH